MFQKRAHIIITQLWRQWRVLKDGRDKGDTNYLEDFAEKGFVLLGLLFMEGEIFVVGPREQAKQVTLRSASRLH